MKEKLIKIAGDVVVGVVVGVITYSIVQKLNTIAFKNCEKDNANK